MYVQIHQSISALIPFSQWQPTESRGRRGQTRPAGHGNQASSVARAHRRATPVPGLGMIWQDQNDRLLKCWVLKNNLILVGGIPTPLQKKSQLGWIFPIYGKIKNVPNQQPVFMLWLNDIKGYIVWDDMIWSDLKRCNSYIYIYVYICVFSKCQTTSSYFTNLKLVAILGWLPWQNPVREEGEVVRIYPNTVSACIYIYILICKKK